ncbi:MAG: hypothetical protein ACR2KK_12105 [Acidimicrobiales bacterium]
MENQYPAASEYWVDAAAVDKYPNRYGDVFATPEVDECVDRKGRRWAHVLVLHPSCELGGKAAADTEVLIARVNAVTAIGATQRAAVRMGWREVDGEAVHAYTNTFWLPPIPGQDDDADWYADFRRLQRVPLGALLDAGREATMTHDARLFLIRREIYFKYRWQVSHADVQAAEASRINGDSNFVGPRPDWATGS